MLAECEAEAGTPAKAASYINEVRSRESVKMPAVNPTNKNDALKAVMHERWVELCGEEVSSIDILRWRKKDISLLLLLIECRDRSIFSLSHLVKHLPIH